MKRKGLAQIPVLIGLLLMAVAIPVATKLVQTNQENRGKAAGCGGTYQLCCNNTTCNSANDVCSQAPGGRFCIPKAIAPTNTPKPVNPSATPAYRNCTVKTCKSGTCVTETKTVASNLACPSSNCTSNANCAQPTDTPNNPTKVPTKTPTSVPGCINNGVCKKTGVSCCSGYSATVATSVCSTGKKCAAVPTPTLKVSNCIVDNIEIPNGEKRCIKFGSLYSRQFKCINGVASLVGYFSSGGCLFPISIPNCEQSTGRSNNCVCNNNIQCSSGYCNTLEARCFSAPTPTPGSGKANGTLCTLDSECLSGNCMKYEGQPKKCVAKQPGGAACNIDSNCISDFCTSVSIVNLSIRKCVPIPNGTRCLYDRDCVSDNCVGKPEDKKCQAKSGSGATCTQNSQCASGRCSGGICVPNPTPTVKVCRNDIDYNGDGVINSLDMIYCSLH